MLKQGTLGTVCPSSRPTENLGPIQGCGGVLETLLVVSGGMLTTHHPYPHSGGWVPTPSPGLFLGAKFQVKIFIAAAPRGHTPTSCVLPDLPMFFFFQKPAHVNIFFLAKKKGNKGCHFGGGDDSETWEADSQMLQTPGWGEAGH